MPKNPFTDLWSFLIGTTGDHLQLGGWRYLVVGLFTALIVVSLTFILRNWREDPAQRNAVCLGTCGVRVLIGCMWFEGMLWKLPLPVSDGLYYWTAQEGTRAAFEFHRVLITQIVLPNIHLLGPIVFLAELTFAVSLILGLGVRLIGGLGVLFVLQLWLGIYRPGEPAEWPWSYIFLAALMFLFSLQAAGRNLGADAWLRRHLLLMPSPKTFRDKLIRFAT